MKLNDELSVAIGELSVAVELQLANEAQRQVKRRDQRAERHH